MFERSWATDTGVGADQQLYRWPPFVVGPEFVKPALLTRSPSGPSRSVSRPCHSATRRWRICKKMRVASARKSWKSPDTVYADHSRRTNIDQVFLNRFKKFFRLPRMLDLSSVCVSLSPSWKFSLLQPKTERHRGSVIRGFVTIAIIFRDEKKSKRKRKTWNDGFLFFFFKRVRQRRLREFPCARDIREREEASTLLHESARAR